MIRSMVDRWGNPLQIERSGVRWDLYDTAHGKRDWLGFLRRSGSKGTGQWQMHWGDFGRKRDSDGTRPIGEIVSGRTIEEATGLRF